MLWQKCTWTEILWHLITLKHYCLMKRCTVKFLKFWTPANLGLHCLPKLVCPKIKDLYGILSKNTWAASWENQQSAYAKTKTQISFAVTAKLISAFVFASWIVQYLYFLNTKFQASSNLQWLHSLVCVRPGQNPHCWFSHVAAHISQSLHLD